MSDATFWGLVDMFCRFQDRKEDMEMAAIMGEPVTQTTECKHPNTAAAPGLERASVWCPDCKKWVVLAPVHDDQARGDS